MIHIALILAWPLCSIGTYAIIGYIDPDDVEGFEAEVMLVCFLLWPLIALASVLVMPIRFICRQMAKLGDWLRGFLVGLFGKDGEKE